MTIDARAPGVPGPDGGPPHVLVVDDDQRLRELLRRYLSDNGFLVATAANAGEARARLKGLRFDLLVLDIMMPGEDGLSLARSLRAQDDVPILMLTAMDSVDDRIQGLETGADDYLVKPFEPRELLLRLNAILRRTHSPEPAAPTAVRFGEFSFDLASGALRKGEAPVALTSAEEALLRALAGASGRPLARDALAARGHPGARALDVQITRLRRKLEPDPRNPRHLVTVRGEGYALRAAPDADRRADEVTR
ncbi:MAG TPA: response regulator [Alphaproteobacteria bacterium]